MKLVYDQHIHSRFSFDSKEEILSYLSLSEENPIVTTEHLEFHNPSDNYRNNLIDYDAYRSHVKTLSDSFGRKILCGVEIGYYAPATDEISSYLDKKDFDLKLLSVHHNDDFDFTQKKVALLPTETLIRDYYTLMIEALESPIEANVLAHFDYGVRLVDIAPSLFKENASIYLDKILDLIISKEMALELNTKSMFVCGKAPLYDFMVSMYLEKGGRLFTLGSDAHRYNSYSYKFEEVQNFLLQKGVREVACFEKGKLYLQPITT